MRTSSGTRSRSSALAVEVRVPHEGRSFAALAKIEGRHISTFDLLDEAELREGTERARRELPERVEYGLEWLVAVAR